MTTSRQKAVGSAAADPEMCHRVDLQGLFNQRIWCVHEFLSRHNPGIVHQNADVPRLSLHLQGDGRGEETVIQTAPKKQTEHVHAMDVAPTVKDKTKA